MVSKSQQYLRYLSYFVILMVYLPIVRDNLPPVIGSYHLYAAIWVASVVLFRPQIFRNKMLLLFLFYGALVLLILPSLLWVHLRAWDITFESFEFYNMILPLSIFAYYMLEKDYKGLAKLTRLALIFIGITALFSIRASFINPLYAREMVGGSQTERLSLQSLGGGSYGYAGAVIGLFPVLIYYYKFNTLSIYNKKIILLFSVVLFFTLIRIQLFANILIAALFVVFSLSGRNNIKKSMIVFAFIVLVITFIPDYIYADALRSLAHFFPARSENYFKITDMATFVESGGRDIGAGEAGQRAARYPMLFYAFLKSPFLGYAALYSPTDIYLGGHLYWMYRLTIWGLFGFVFYLWVQYKWLRYALTFFNDNYKFFFLLAAGAILSYGLLKNIDGKDVWYMYFLILPGMYYLPLLRKKTKIK